MSEVSDRLAKRKESRTEEASILLDDQLAKDLATLEVERQALIDAPASDTSDTGKKRLASPASIIPVEPDTADVDARIAAKQAEIRANTLRLLFKAVPSARYDELLAEYPDVDEDDVVLRKFLDVLTDESLHAVFIGDDRQDGVTMTELRPDLSGGEMMQIRDLVYVVNRRQAPAIPFSSNGSKTTP